MPQNVESVSLRDERQYCGGPLVNGPEPAALLRQQRLSVAPIGLPAAQPLLEHRVATKLLFSYQIRHVGKEHNPGRYTNRPSGCPTLRAALRRPRRSVEPSAVCRRPSSRRSIEDHLAGGHRHRTFGSGPVPPKSFRPGRPYRVPSVAPGMDPAGIFAIFVRRRTSFSVRSICISISACRIPPMKL